MTQRNSIGRMLVALFDRLLGSSAGGAATVGIVLFAVGVVCLDEANAAAVYAGAFLVGVDFIFDGISLIALGTAVKKVPAGREFARA